MPDANDLLRATEGLRQAQEQVSGIGKGLSGGTSSLTAFFKSPDNLIALAICLVSLVGIYRLLRSEHIIPAYQKGGGLFSSALAQRLAIKIIFVVVIASLGLALMVGRMSRLLEAVRGLF
jgi:hypothetical protein